MAHLAVLLGDYTFRTVAVGCGMLGVLSGVLGSFAVLRRQSLLGDGVSHAALPGVVLAFLITGSKNTGVLLLGALITGLLSAVLINGITRHSKIKFDSALALVMSVFFGLGMVLLTWAQKRPDANQAGLKRFIYGQASTLLKEDTVLIALVGAVLLLVVLVFWKEFKVLSFDPALAASLGLPVRKLELLLTFLMVAAIILGLQTVGVILMSAMLIAPAAAARQWTGHLWLMVVLSAFFGALSGILGTLASSAVLGLPTGPAIVVCVTVIALISLLAAPGRGLLQRVYLRQKSRNRLKKQEGRTKDESGI